MQNVGAYGQEVSDTIAEVEVFDTATMDMTTLARAQCRFGYRTSRFKRDDLGRFVVCGVQFALEVHPTEIAFDLVTAARALAAVERREEFGFNFDPSHLVWQGVDPVEFLRAFRDRTYHVHVKDVVVQLNGRSGILGSHLPFGDSRRGWDFRSPGRGSVDFEQIIRALNEIKYAGPLSVEWEDPGMDGEEGEREE